MKRFGRVLPRRGTIFLEFFTAAVTAAALVVGLGHQLFGGGNGQRSYPGEGRRIVAFRQVANRICEENLQNMRRAREEANGTTQLLSFVHRAIGWDLHDITTITPPPTIIEEFLDEVAVRRHIGTDIDRLRKSLASGNASAETRVLVDLRKSEAQSAEMSARLALPKCRRVVLRPHALVADGV